MSGIDRSGKALVEHWNWAAEKGLMNQHTAAALRTACAKVLEAVDGWEVSDVTTMDAEDVFRRFQNKNSKVYKPKTLEEYRRRFLQAVQQFVDYVNDPSGWRPHARSRTAREKPGRSTTRTPSSSGQSQGPKGAVESAKGYMEYSYKLPGDRTAVLRLPVDLTLADGRRVGAFLSTLATDFEPGEL